MTRWARAGNAQKHKKLPGDATKWGEFDLQKTNCKSSEQQVKIQKKQNVSHNASDSDFSGGKIAQSVKNNESHESSVKKKIKNIESERGIKTNKKALSSMTEGKASMTHEESSCQEECSSAQNISVKKQKIKKKKFIKQNDVHAEIPKVSDLKTFEKKKGMYLEKLKKKRAENGILLLPSKVERKLYNIKRKLREKRLSPSVIKDIIRKERRKEELKFRKTFNPSKLCFSCREAGHVLADCPLKLGSSNQETGICFKCGSAEHTSFKCPEKVQGFPFAKCFICKEQGHISKDCPVNKHGVYPKGGRCNLCGNVNHLRKDCPSLNKRKCDEPTVTLPTINDGTSIDAEVSETHSRKEKIKRPKIVKF